jgi:restriction system protein
MSIPDYQTLMLPLLRFAADGKEHRFREAVEYLASELSISDEERKELLPSGTALVFDNRVGWARTYLKQAGLLESPKRGFFHISERGKALLNENPAHVDVTLLGRYEEFRAFRTRRRDKPPAGVKVLDVEQDTNETPEDALAAAYVKLRKNLETELLEQVKDASPAFFERLV